MFLDLSNLSAITIAFPTIQKELSADVGQLQWIISAYAVTVRERCMPLSYMHVVDASSSEASCCWVAVVVMCWVKTTFPMMSITLMKASYTYLPTSVIDKCFSLA
jgi:hypothetical protein